MFCEVAGIEPSVYIQIEENPNCQALDGQVFQPRTSARVVTHACLERNGQESWFNVTGLDDDAQQCPAMACIIDDSGDGACYLVTGGGWGLRFRVEAAGRGWDLNDSEQWGAPFLLMAGDGSDLRFG
jgi:hypothetical protein